MDLGDAVVFLVALGAHEGNDVEVELAVGQGQTAFRFGVIGTTEAGTLAVGAGANGQRVPNQGGESGQGAGGRIDDAEPATTDPTVCGERFQVTMGGGRRAGT
jgi:hypothetical protein